MRTFRAISVRLIEPLDGECNRTIESVRVKSLTIEPSSRQAFVVTSNDREFVAGYERAELFRSELTRMLEIHQCEDCGMAFENAQGLGSHRSKCHPVVAQASAPLTATQQANVKGQRR